MSSDNPLHATYESPDDNSRTLEDEEWQDDALDTEEASSEEHEEELEQPFQESHPQSPASAITLELTVRCGSVTLTLDALQRLAPGAVIEVAGITPGYATLCHGERVIAEGELVDLDGRLGLQITRMAFDQ